MNENLAAIYARARSKDFKKNHGFCEFDGVGVSLNEASPETRDRDCTPFIDVMGEYMCVVDIGYH
ncbi:hypothetical protein N431DRAFT_435759 [Stipitochalara longipes BDJ]|nr:hypothetical protein N431DRAFT_435759 [Stipitochalara longipes BDJ]